ncbi:hypothetical protein GOP47_0009839 [Adiantum capillus-veneris]|uniref:Uncharacterized protein n=1 Tax=Adiantum capillus-veneris TaxID=13818 RepID=A0A9D4UXC8_ADICA|nr:hypothetical protein GOP47_0009839 [Adiantum capillus-veneris]
MFRDDSTVDDAALNEGKKAKCNLCIEEDIVGLSVAEEKDKSGEKSKTWREYRQLYCSVVELCSTLAEGGLSTVGTKKTLHSRLSGALNATQPADSVRDADEDDGVSCIPTTELSSFI